MAEKLSWFPLDAHEFLTSRAIMAMKPQDAGTYVRLLCHQWVGGPLPRDFAAMGALVGLSTQAMRATWERIGNCFADTGFGWVSEDLESIRNEQTAKFAKRAKAGAIGAKSRWQSHADANGNRIATAEQPQCDTNAIREDKITTPPYRSPQTAGAKPKGSGKAKSATTLPADWEPIASHREKALVSRLDLDDEVEGFRNHHLAKGSRFVDWNAAFHTWLRKAVEFGRAGKATNGAGWDEVQRFLDDEEIV
jgi:uncharacterized protein YdaU (DUF1376 family)